MELTSEYLWSPSNNCVENNYTNIWLISFLDIVGTDFNNTVSNSVSELGIYRNFNVRKLSNHFSKENYLLCRRKGVLEERIYLTRSKLFNPLNDKFKSVRTKDWKFIHDAHMSFEVATLEVSINDIRDTGCIR